MGINAVIDSITGSGRCLICSCKTDGYPICLACRHRLKTDVYNKRCARCSIPLISETGLCTRCRERDFSFGSNYSLFPYSGDIKELIYQYKFMNNKSLSFLFAELLYEGYIKSSKPDALIPVPSAPTNVKRRGWDHMAAVSSVLSKHYNQRILNCIKRRESQSQKKLGYSERFINLKGKIVFIQKCRPVSGNILLIDDIFTTGATLEQCASVLKENGFRTVNALTIAID